MAGPFARLRRGEAEATPDDQPTEMLQAVTADDGATADAPMTETPIVEEPAPAAEPAVVVEEHVAADTVPGEETPGWIERGKLRRRLRFVRRARELALRDLGGLVFDLHRFGRERNDLVEQKLSALSTLDSEMRALEALLEDQPEITVLNEPGLASCPRCGALHASDAAYCSACGLPVGNRADLPSGPALAGPVPALPTPAAEAAAEAPPAPEPEPDPTDPAQEPIATEAVVEEPAPEDRRTAAP
jgi:hypothetical protein